MEYITLNSEVAKQLQSTLAEVRAELKRVREQRTGKEPMTLAQASDYLNVAPKTLAKYIRDKHITPSPYGKRVCVTKNELDQFIEHHRVTHH